MQPVFFSQRQPLWLRLLHKAMLPDAKRAFGWLSDEGHWNKRPGNYCHGTCRICASQREIDTNKLMPRRRKTPVL
jgi:hypothetical protein